MAEPVGLVFGGLGLIGTFNACMNTFELIESGKQYGRAYQKSALEIELLHLRLSRWKQNVHFEGDRTVLPLQCIDATPKEAETVEWLLGEINVELQAAQGAAARYAKQAVGGAEREEGGAESSTIEALTLRVRTLALTRQRTASAKDKVMWALRDEKKLKRLIEDVSGHIDSLVELFPAAVATDQTQRAAADLVQIVQPSEIEEPLDPEEAANATALLREASDHVDPELVAAIEALAAKEPAPGGEWTLKEVTVRGKARMLNGHQIIDKNQYLETKSRYLLQDVVARGNSKVVNGHQFGGKSVFDD